MMIDHTGALLGYDFMRLIGRIAFPIYVFLIAEGCRHTKDIKKYLFRLALFALISEPAFDLLFGNLFYPQKHVVFFWSQSQNVFFTLFLGVLSAWWLDFCKERKNHAMIWLLGFGLIMSLGTLLHTDYGTMGILAIFCCYYFKERRQQILVLTLFVFYMYKISIMALVALAGVGLLFLYNGKPGPRMKWFFYISYPAHLLVLAGIYFFIINPR